jgi:hypothetical protein
MRRENLPPGKPSAGAATITTLNINFPRKPGRDLIAEVGMLKLGKRLAVRRLECRVFLDAGSSWMPGLLGCRVFLDAGSSWRGR